MQADTQASDNFFRRHQDYFILSLSVLALCIVSTYNFKLFLFLLAYASAMLAFIIFVFTVNTRKISTAPFLEVLGTVFIYVAVIQALFIFWATININLDIQHQLWASGQFIEGVAFLAMIALIYTRPTRRTDNRLLHIAYSLLFVILMLSIFYWHSFPNFYNTSFSEMTFTQKSTYGSIVLMPIISLAGLWHKRYLFDPFIFKSFVGFLAASIFSNLSEAFFIASPTIHAVSHLLNMTGLYMLYYAIVKAGLTKPFSLLLKDLNDQKEHLEKHVKERTQILAKEVAHHKKTAQQLTESKNRYLRLAERDPDWIYRYRLTEPQGYEYSNPAVKTITGFAPEEFCNNPTLFLSLAHPDDRAWWQTQKANWNNFPWHETILTRLIINGKTLWLEERLIPVYDDKGNLIAAEGIGRDVSQQKQIESAFKNRTNELGFLINTSKLFNQSLNLDDVLSTLLDEVRALLNINFCSVWLIDPKTKDLICKDITEPLREKFRGTRDPRGKGLTGWVVKNRKTLNVKNTSEPSPDYEIYYDLDDFDYFNKSVLSVPLQSGKHIVGVLQIIDNHLNRFKPEDISLLESLAGIAAIAIENASLYDQAIRDAQTKLTLLKEVNHRVKNNLAAISGLIYLEKSNSEIKTNENYQETMDNLISRVRGLSAIHNLLSSTEWQPVLLKSLIESIINETIRVTASQPDIIFSITVPTLKIDSEQAHHLAMVLNELTINSFKHAKGNASRKLEISINTQIDEDWLYLNFKDNGPGFPNSILKSPFLKNHVGFELIHGIVQNNLQGTVSLKNDHGAVIALSLKLKVIRPLA